MHTKPLALCLAALLLAGCDNTGTGSYQLDAYSLNGTSTAIAATATTTAVYGYSTATAAAYIVNVNGTATAVQVTATAQAIGTAKAQITNAEALVILEQGQISLAVAHAEATATAAQLNLEASEAAAASQLEIARNMEKAARQSQFAFFGLVARWAFLVVIIIALLAGIGVGAYFIYYRTLYEDTAVKDYDGVVKAVRHDYRVIPANAPVIIQQSQPQPRPQPLFVDHAGDNGASRAGSLPAPDTGERLAINTWLMQVLNGAEFNRTTAKQWNIGSDRADLLIKSAIRQGYAQKGEGQTSPVIPLDNFGDFIDKIIGNSPAPGAPVSNLPSPA